jgi:hypothetical protein
VSDWSVDTGPALPRLRAVVLAFTAHHFVLADIDGHDIRAGLEVLGPGGPLSATFLAWLADQAGGTAGSVDLTLAECGSGVGTTWLRPVVQPPPNEQVERARRLRTDVTCLSPPDGAGTVCLGLGIADRHELSVAVHPDRGYGTGLGTRLVVEALAIVPAGTPVFAAVAPGNSRSLRCLLTAGFVPIGAECVVE